MSDPTKDTLTGEREVRVTFRDGSTANVKIIELPIRKLPEMLASFDDEPALIELYTGKDEAWIDSLTNTSFENLLSVGGELNFPVMVRWMDRKGETLRRLNPVTDRLQNSTNSLPTSVSPAGSDGQTQSR